LALFRLGTGDRAVPC